MPPTVIAVSFPITCAATWVTTSGMTGFTFPGMIELPFWSSGRKISASPARGPEPMSRRSLAIFVSETATTFSAPEASTRASLRGLRLERVRWCRDREPGLLSEEDAHAGRELRVSVQPGAGRGAAERNLPQARQRGVDPRDPLPDLRRVARELLSERDGDGIHHVRPPRLHDVVELRGLALQRRGERVERGPEVVGELVERREVDGGREDVVRGLAHVDVVVRVDVVAGEGGDDLVRVHVRARAGAGLEDVDRELVVELAGGDAVAGCGDPLRLVGVEQAELGVRARGGGLDPAEPAGHGDGNRLTGDGEVVHGLARLGAPELAVFGRLAHAASLAVPDPDDLEPSV